MKWRVRGCLNYMEQVEKVAFSPSNLLDGAELSDDIRKKVLEYFNKVSSDLAKRIEIEMKK